MLEDKEKHKISGMTVNVCQIASLNDSGYYPVAAFEKSGVSIAGVINNSGEAVAKTLLDYVEKNNVKCESAISENGKATFEELNLGIWLVFPQKGEKHNFNPYIVFLPFESGGKVSYDITSAPKIEDSAPQEINIYVIKRWEDKNNASKKRPESVEIELLDGDRVVSSAVLNEEKGWAHTFLKVNNEGKYAVREKTVAGYKVDYSGDVTNGFVVTNTYNGEKLPQTGQYWWPIILITIAGAGFILLGVYEMVVQRNGKEK